MEQNVVEPTVIEGRDIIVLYGSETGNAEDIALELSKMTRRLHFKTVCDEMDEVKLAELIKYRLAIFVTSTTGQGDLPRNTAKFWTNLRRTRLNNTNCLGALKFTIFGLGDSSYPNVNAAARKLRARLKQLGATEFFRPGEGDERHDNGIDSAYLPWSQELREHLVTDYPLPGNLQPIADDIPLPPKYHIEFETGNVFPTKSLSEPPTPSSDSLQPEPYPPTELLDIPNSLTALVNSNTRVTPTSHWQDVRHIELSVQAEKKDISLHKMLPFLAGATAVIYPKNFPQDVQTLTDMMGWDSLADRQFDRNRSTLPKKLYPLTTCQSALRDLLTHNFDITAVPKRSFLREMSHFATNENEKERLLEFTKPGNQQEFYDYTSRPRRTTLEVLRDFPSVKIPLRYALEMFPLIRGREFSICNGATSVPPTFKEDGKFKVELTAALVEYKTIIRKPREGLCSRYLKHLKAGTTIKISINPPTSPTLRPENMLVGPETNRQGRPLIAVATGTGIAPIRALINDRKAAGIKAPALLFFGCRNEKADFLFENEHSSSKQQSSRDEAVYWGDNVRVIPAFSRDENPTQVKPLLPPPGGVESETETEMTDRIPTDMLEIVEQGKNYVQHQIKKHGYEISRLLMGNVAPVICVCGNAGRMPERVRSAFEDVLVEYNLVSGKEDAKTWVNNSDKVVYWQEVW
ncbi:NADPH-dependent FMN/FAD containing oxidoreductase [Rhypophila sp. PSN 637]